MWAVAGAVVLAGCVGGKGMTSEERERLKPYVLDAAPTNIAHPLDVNFENKVHLIGYKFEPETARPGTDVKLTYYWRCDSPLDDGWLLFTHTKDEGTGKMGNLDFVGPLREERRGGHQLLGPEHWEKGKVYVDEQAYKVPAEVTGAEVTIMVGVWKGDARLRIISGPSDGDNSAIVGHIETGLTPKPAEEHTLAVPVLVVNKLAKNAGITIDGKGTEPEWGSAASTGPFVDVGSGKPNAASLVQGSAKLTWDDKDLYVFYAVKDADAYTGFTNAKAQPDDFTVAGQPKLWMRDTVEMMVDPGPAGDNKDYFELQVGPQNKVFKSRFDTLQQPSGGPNGPFGHEDWDPKLKSAVSLQKGADGKVTGYSVEIEIPWAGYETAAAHPPHPGDVWRVNFYAMKHNGGVAWSPILGQGNFHNASRFGRVTWAASAGTPPATAPVAIAPMPEAHTVQAVPAILHVRSRKTQPATP
ncbi:MAG: carbohydrate-binding family 9-like protein [Polyangiaceae bacterium]